MGTLYLRMPRRAGDEPSWRIISVDAAGPATPAPDNVLYLRLPDNTWVKHVPPGTPGATPLRLHTWFGWEIVCWLAGTGGQPPTGIFTIVRRYWFVPGGADVGGYVDVELQRSTWTVYEANAFFANAAAHDPGSGGGHDYTTYVATGTYSGYEPDHGHDYPGHPAFIYYLWV